MINSLLYFISICFYTLCNMNFSCRKSYKLSQYVKVSRNMFYDWNCNKFEDWSLACKLAARFLFRHFIELWISDENEYNDEFSSSSKFDKMAKENLATSFERSLKRGGFKLVRIFNRGTNCATFLHATIIHSIFEEKSVFTLSSITQRRKSLKWTHFESISFKL